jgi:hypothetical protein
MKLVDMAGVEPFIFTFLVRLLKYYNHLNIIWEFSSYLTVNTRLLCLGNNRCFLMRESREMYCHV